jgi:hypothetical protein
VHCRDGREILTVRVIVWNSHRDTVLKQMGALRAVMVLQRRLKAIAEAFEALVAVGTFHGSTSSALDALWTFRPIVAVLSTPLPDSLDVPDPALANVSFSPIFTDCFQPAREQHRSLARIVHLLRLLLALPVGAGLRNVGTEPPKSPSPSWLQLAICVFRCVLCTRILTGSNALTHRCEMWKRRNMRNVHYLLFENISRQLPWNFGNSLVFDLAASQAAARLVRLSGRDERLATSAELGQMNYRCDRAQCRRPQFYSFTNVVCETRYQMITR